MLSVVCLASLHVQVGLLLGAGVSGLVGGAHVGGAILLATAALAVFVFWLWREQVGAAPRSAARQPWWHLALLARACCIGNGTHSSSRP